MVSAAGSGSVEEPDCDRARDKAQAARPSGDLQNQLRMFGERKAVCMDTSVRRHAMKRARAIFGGRYPWLCSFRGTPYGKFFAGAQQKSLTPHPLGGDIAPHWRHQ